MDPSVLEEGKEEEPIIDGTGLEEEPTEQATDPAGRPIRPRNLRMDPEKGIEFDKAPRTKLNVKFDDEKK
jgi:hypothetical protein